MANVQGKLALLQKRSLASELENEIERLILVGTLKVGGRVNELQLADTFGVSRSPVREALRALEASGLVEAVPNRGIFIRRVNADQALKVYGVRAALFGYAAQLLAEKANAADLRQLQELHGTLSEAANAQRFEDYFPLNFSFHEFIVQAGGNDVLALQYQGLVKQLRLFRGRNLLSGDTMVVSHSEHEAIVEAIVQCRPDAAYRAAFDHVERGRQRMMNQLEAETREGVETEPGRDAKDGAIRAA